MLYRIIGETTWHDGPNLIVAPAGELVEVIDIKQVPDARDRRDIADGIEAYAKQRRDCVPIRIRDWYALIDRSNLELVKTGPTPLLVQKSRQKRLELPGLQVQQKATCATE